MANASKDLSGIPKKVIWTWGANRLAIPKKKSVIKIIIRAGEANWVLTIITLPTNLIKSFNMTPFKLKKLELSILSGGNTV